MSDGLVVLAAWLAWLAMVLWLAWRVLRRVPPQSECVEEPGPGWPGRPG